MSCGCSQLLLVLASFYLFINTAQGITDCISVTGTHGQCKPLIKCVRFFHEIPTLRSSPCTLSRGDLGVCCPHVSLGIIYTVGPVTYLHQPKIPPISFPTKIRPVVINKALSFAKTELKKRSNLEKELLRSGLTILPGTAASKHHRNQRTSARAKTLGIKATEFNVASKEISKNFGLTPRQNTFGLPKVKVDESASRNELCKDILPPKCDDPLLDKYRSVDGSCNNKRNTRWGAQNVALSRLISPSYEDGLSDPRGGENLPYARKVSDILIADKNSPSDQFTLLLMQWGQFLDHDMVHTPVVQGQNEEEVMCCNEGKPITGQMKHPECFPIKISKDDTFYSSFGNECMEFIRSMPALRDDCNLGPREQVNQITSFLDGSNIYGSNQEEISKLRLGQYGRLRITRYGPEELLPLAPDECQDSLSKESCFDAGDERVNEQPQLTVMHTLWLREHNRLASELSYMNPHWGDERVFQEARKIVGATIQHITYNEWLPIILGYHFLEKEKMSLLEDGYALDYDENLNPGVTNAFATAAFRFGHSLVQGVMDWYNVYGYKLKPLRLHQHQFQPHEIYEVDAIDNFIRGLVIQPSQKLDASFSSEITQHLFQGNETAGKGLDLVALNIQRGRDHGIPSYIEFRRLCGLPEIRTWKELSKLVSIPELVPRLQQLYQSIGDIDLFVGGMTEKKASTDPYGGGILGDTFQCLVGDQFKRSKNGDRFWYENSGIFTPAQLKEIRNTNMARILCDNGKLIRSIQPMAFKSNTAYMNGLVPCEGVSIPKLHLHPWKE